MQQQLSHDLIQAQIAQALTERSQAEYNLGKARAEVTRYEAIIKLHDQSIEGLENARSVLATLERQLTEQMVKAPPAQAAAPAPLPMDGPPAHITQEVKAPPSRGGKKAGRKPTGRPPGRPKGSGVKPQKMHDEVTVAGYNGSGMTPGEAASE